jgi:hypothetical protein
MIPTFLLGAAGREEIGRSVPIWGRARRRRLHLVVGGGADERGERRRARRASEVRRERRGGAEARRAGGDRSGRRLARFAARGRGIERKMRAQWRGSPFY